MCSTGITGQSSKRGMCVIPKTYLNEKYMRIERIRRAMACKLKLDNMSLSWFEGGNEFEISKKKT